MFQVDAIEFHFFGHLAIFSCNWFFTSTLQVVHFAILTYLMKPSKRNKKNRRNILGPVNKTSRPFFLNFFSNFCLLCDLQHQCCLLLLLAHWHSLTNDSICCSVGTQLRRPRPPSFSSFGFVNISRRLLDIVQAVTNGKRVHRLLPMSFVSDWHDTRNFEFFRRFQVILHFWDTIL